MSKTYDRVFGTKGFDGHAQRNKESAKCMKVMCITVYIELAVVQLNDALDRIKEK